MKSSHLKIALAVSLLFNFSVMAGTTYVYFTQKNAWTTPFGAKLQKDRFLFEPLSLRPEQIQAMRDKAVPFREILGQKRKEIITRKMELLTLMRSDISDHQLLNKKLAEISSLQGAIEAMVVEHIHLVKSTLNKEQQQKFIDLLQKNMQPEKLNCLPVAN